MKHSSKNPSPSRLEKIGLVAIGRNEGERLKRCLYSVIGQVEHIVYVDSGSTDGSVEFARTLGVDVVDLDMTRPFTMARGRNAGFERLQQTLLGIQFVQFVDGDCEIQPGWIDAAIGALTADSTLGSVCGRRTERYPERSPYNRLTDMDWRGPTGIVKFCGGDVMMRAAAFVQCGGYRDEMIAGEDPEICVRLRQLGWTLQRLDLPMTIHDAAMTRFGQWWMRTVRSGHAYAEGERMYRQSSEMLWRREVRSNWIWGIVIPFLTVALALPSSGLSLLAFGIYPVWMLRIARGRCRAFQESWADACLYGVFCMLGKLPAALGQLLFLWRILIRRKPQLIEYKTSQQH